MTRTVFRGGSVFDGTGADPRPADITVEDGRIVDVGTNLDGDEAVDAAGSTILPGLFDCHVHVVLETIDTWRIANQPFSYRFYLAARHLRPVPYRGTHPADPSECPQSGDAHQPDDAEPDRRPW